MIIELRNQRAGDPSGMPPGDPEGMIVVAQHGTITVRKIMGGKPVPYQEITPDGDFEQALAAKLTFLHAAGFELVG